MRPRSISARRRKKAFPPKANDAAAARCHRCTQACVSCLRSRTAHSVFLNASSRICCVFKHGYRNASTRRHGGGGGGGGGSRRRYGATPLPTQPALPVTLQCGRGPSYQESAVVHSILLGWPPRQTQTSRRLGSFKKKCRYNLRVTCQKKKAPYSQ